MVAAIEKTTIQVVLIGDRPAWNQAPELKRVAGIDLGMYRVEVDGQPILKTACFPCSDSQWDVLQSRLEDFSLALTEIEKAVVALQSAQSDLGSYALEFPAPDTKSGDLGRFDVPRPTFGTIKKVSASGVRWQKENAKRTTVATENVYPIPDRAAFEQVQKLCEVAATCGQLLEDYLRVDLGSCFDAPAREAVLSQPVESELNFWEYTIPIPVLYQGYNDDPSEAVAVACNHKFARLIKPAGDESLTPIGRILQWRPNVQKGDRVKVMACDPTYFPVDLVGETGILHVCLKGTAEVEIAGNLYRIPFRFLDQVVNDVVVYRPASDPETIAQGLKEGWIQPTDPTKAERICDRCQHSKPVEAPEGKAFECELKKVTGAVMSGGIMAVSLAHNCDSYTLLQAAEPDSLSEFLAEISEALEPNSDNIQPANNALQVESITTNLPWTFIPDFMDEREADSWLEYSRDDLKWKQNAIKMFGKQTQLPRLEAIYGWGNYTYNGLTLEAEPWTDDLKDLAADLEAKTGYKFHMVIGNQYRNGNDHIGWHSDDSPEMGDRPAIASISLGATRKFQLRHKKTKEIHTFELTHGSLFIMHPGCQEEWQHRICKTSGDVGLRINWTFRPLVGQTQETTSNQEPVSPNAVFQVGDRVKTLRSIRGCDANAVFQVEGFEDGLADLLLIGDPEAGIMQTPCSNLKLAEPQLELAAQPDQPVSEIVAIADIRIDGNTQIRVDGLDQATVARYAALWREYGDECPLSPVKLIRDADGNLWLFDGFHTRQGALDAERTHLKAEIWPGTKDDAQWRSCFAQASRGLGLSKQDQRHAIQQAIKLNATRKPPESERSLAKLLGCDPGTIRYNRKKLEESGEIAATENETVVANRNGKVYEIKPHTSSYTFDDIARLYAPLGKFQKTGNPKLPYELERLGSSKFFTSLEDAAAKHEAIAAAYTPAVPTAASEEISADTAEAAIEVSSPKHSAGVIAVAGNCERYTPEAIWRPALEVFGVTEFDLDPSSWHGSPIPCKRIFTKAEDGLIQDWTADNAWSNFPYSDRDESDKKKIVMHKWVRKLVEEYSSGRLKRAVTLVKSDCRPAWFHELNDIATAFCLIRKAVPFATPGESVGEDGEDDDQKISGSFFGSILFYLGDELDKFYYAYSPIGSVCQAVNPEMFGE